MEDEKLKKILQQEWNIQGFIATPLYIATCGNSGLHMDDIGVHYKSILYHFKNDYVEMFYNIADLKKIWCALNKKSKENPYYFQWYKEKYNENFSRHLSFLSKLTKEYITSLDDKRFILEFKKLLQAQEDTVGIGHAIEAFSMLHDRKLLQILKNKGVPKEKLNKYSEILSHPIKNSWLNKSENDLTKINPKDLDSIELHAKKWHWIHNNYLNAEALDVKYFQNQLFNKKKHKILDYRLIKENKQKLISELNLDKETINLINLIEFFTILQDKRKKNILSTLYYLELFCIEASKRFEIELKNIKYLMPLEINKIHKITNNELRIRREGCLIISTEGHDEIISGQKFKEIEDLLYEKNLSEVLEIHGLPASSGNAIGPVIICKNAESISKVNEGDVIVAPMTRPEYVPAMRKAAAIITDEGGVTCHAAIVSRELGIPCIIGTKNATKILNNGDLVEVKGNHGLIVIIEKKLK